MENEINVSSKDEILQALKNTALPVIISGAGIVGKVLLSICREEGIAVDCFCDNSVKAAQSDFCGLKVFHTSDLKKKYDDALFLVSVASIKDAVERFYELGFTNWRAGGLLLRDFDVCGRGFDAKAEYAINTCVLCHDAYLHPDKLFLRSIDLIITERCTLKCKDCSNLMQYYERPEHCSLESVMRSIDAFCAVIDEVIEFRLLGGEALLNKDWPVITERLLKEPKVKRIVFYTNGTILPNEKHIPCLRDEKILFSITDYGSLSRKLEPLKQLLKDNGIKFFVASSPVWLDCSSVTAHNRTVEQQKEIYRDCCGKNMVTLSDGKVFRCPYAANAARLAAVPDAKSDYVDLNEFALDAAGIQKAKTELREYLLWKEYLGTCDYCAGRPLSGVEVPAAVQAQRALPYKKYRREPG